MFDVVITTDGSCSGNPGPGGYCAIVECKGRRKIVQGSVAHATNNTMELMAVVKGLQALTKPCNVTVESDSAYIIGNINGGRLDEWIKRDWITVGGSPVANRQLWDDLDRLRKIHSITFVKVHGHAGHPRNCEADQIARAQTNLAKLYYHY